MNIVMLHATHLELLVHSFPDKFCMEGPARWLPIAWLLLAFWFPGFSLHSEALWPG